MQNELFMIDNPCIGVCAMNKKDYCMGCFRNRTERQTWHIISNGERAKILKNLGRRRRNISAPLRHKQRQTLVNYEFDFYGQFEQLSFDF
ncbi:hypothetical protein B0182_12055 [Moraxella bovis]|nr:hypothetical protein B0182_12055 [Moraxella bovis]